MGISSERELSQDNETVDIALQLRNMFSLHVGITCARVQRFHIRYCYDGYSYALYELFSCSWGQWLSGATSGALGLVWGSGT